MGNDLFYLPMELLLEIVRKLPPESIPQFAYSSKKSWEISAKILLERANTTASLTTAIRVIRRLNDEVLEDDFVRRVRDQATNAINNGDDNGLELDNAWDILKLLDELPRPQRIPAAYFLGVSMTIRARVVQHINDRHFRGMQYLLSLLEILPRSTHIPADLFLGAAVSVGDCVVEALDKGELYLTQMLEALATLSLFTTIPDNVFLKVATSVRCSAIHALTNDGFDDTTKMLVKLRNLPLSTHIPADFFHEVVTRARASIVQSTTSKQLYGVMLVIRALEKLPPCTKTPANVFREAAETAGAIIVQALQIRDFDEVTSMFKSLDKLPEISHDLLREVATAVRECIVRILSDSQFPDVISMLRVVHLRLTGGNPDKSFFEVLATARVCVIRALNSGKFSDANSILGLMTRLQDFTDVPANFSLDIIKAVRACLVDALNNRRLSDGKSLLNILDKAVSMSVLSYRELPADFFLGVATTARNCIVQYLEQSQFSDAKSTIDVVNGLDQIVLSSHKPLDDLFLDIAKTSAVYITKALKDGQFSEIEPLLVILSATFPSVQIEEFHTIIIVKAIANRHLPTAISTFTLAESLTEGQSYRQTCHICGGFRLYLGTGRSDYCLAGMILRYFDIDYLPSEHARYKATHASPNLEKYFLFSWYGDLENFEMTNRCWRTDYRLQVRGSPLFGMFGNNIDLSYPEWLSIHEHALHAIKSVFQSKGWFSEELDVGVALARLWPFLPSGLSRNGVSWEEQKYLVSRVTESSTEETRKVINDFLDELCRNVDLDTLQRQTSLDSGSTTVTPQHCLVFQRILFKRLLLQTPLVFWPAIFVRGISRLVDEPQDAIKIQKDGSDIYVECANMHAGSGYEVLSLWSQLMETQRISSPIKNDVKDDSKIWLRLQITQLA
jgi:hypothetical protein